MLKAKILVFLITVLVLMTSVRMAAAQPSANEIVFSGGNAYDFGGNIFSVRADGSGQVNLTNDPTGSYGHASWSNDGSKIVFTRNGSIGTMNADGTDRLQISTGQQSAWHDKPVWSPDGRRIVFEVTDYFDYVELHIMNADGGDQRFLYNGGDAAWSPDGSKIAFARGWFIYTINPDGTGAVAITANIAGYDFQPNWSPDGSKIAFTSNRDRPSPNYYINDIYVVNTDGSDLRRLTFSATPHSESYPSWSPDGTRLAFSDGDIYIMNVDGTNVVRITNNAFSCWNPDWRSVASPVANQRVSGRVMAPDGRGLRNATVSMTDLIGNVRLATTSSFGFYSFDNVPRGSTYVFRVSSRLFRFSSQSVLVNGNLTLPDFLGLE